MDFKKLEEKIQNTFEQGVTLEEAERLAAEFLHAQIRLNPEISAADLDARMRKSGVKAIRAALYTNILSRTEKKPTEASIESEITNEKMVQDEQDALDSAEVKRDELKRMFDILNNAHIYYRGVAKGGNL